MRLKTNSAKLHSCGWGWGSGRCEGTLEAWCVCCTCQPRAQCFSRRAASFLLSPVPLCISWWLYCLSVEVSPAVPSHTHHCFQFSIFPSRNGSFSWGYWHIVLQPLFLWSCFACGLLHSEAFRIPCGLRTVSLSILFPLFYMKTVG